MVRPLSVRETRVPECINHMCLGCGLEFLSTVDHMCVVQQAGMVSQFIVVLLCFDSSATFDC